MRGPRLVTFTDAEGIVRTKWDPDPAEVEASEERAAEKARTRGKGQPTPPIQPDGRWDGRVRRSSGAPRAEPTSEHVDLAAWMNRTKVV